MNNLEKKFKVPKDKILIDEKLWKHLVSKIEKLQQQLDNQKYLDRDVVEKELWKFYDIIKYQLLEYSFIKSNIGKTAGAICSLATEIIEGKEGERE